jgi:hypothetical protein
VEVTTSVRAIFEYDATERTPWKVTDHQSGTLKLTERSLKREKQSFEAVELNVGTV